MNRIVNTNSYLRSKTLLASFTVLALLLIVGNPPQGVGTSLVPHAQAQAGGCNLATVAGTYAVSSQGTSPLGPFVSVALSTNDGAGNFSGYGRFSLDGTVGSATFTGTYTVNPDCTYSSTLADNYGTVIHASGVIIRKGEEVMAIQTDAGSWLSLVAKKQAQGRGCNLATVAGTYAFSSQGTLPLGPVVSVGVQTNDGAGNFSGHGEFSLNGTVGSTTFTGTYAVNPDCTYSSTLNDNFGNVRNYSGVILDKGKEAMAIQTDAGSLVSVVAKKQ